MYAEPRAIRSEETHVVTFELALKDAGCAYDKNPAGFRRVGKSFSELRPGEGRTSRSAVKVIQDKARDGSRGVKCHPNDLRCCSNLCSFRP